MEQDKTQNQFERSHYRSSLVATVLFSGVQFYQIIIRIIKTKFVALFIGPTGMGIQSLLHSTTDTISAATNLGLNTSSVKTISAAYKNGNRVLISENVTIQRRLIWITGIVGLLVCAIFAPLWSHFSFGDDSYSWQFVCVSLVILFDQLNKGELALLQGMIRKKELARANVIGQTLNALLTIPLYYFWGVKAIVAALVLGSLISLWISFSFSRKLGVESIRMPWRETFRKGREMIKLGFFLSLQALLSYAVIFFVRSYVSQNGGLDEVGLYSAGTAIVNVYLGLVFSAISTSYFPRLAGTKTNEDLEDTVRKQAEISMLLFAPIIVAFIIFIKPVIVALYSERFLPIEKMLYWAMAATLIKALGWAMSYTVLAKAKPFYFFLNELFTKCYTFPLAIMGYKYFGLTGFGIALLIGYSLYLIQEIVVVKKLFDISYDFSIWRLCILLHLPILFCYVIKSNTSTFFSYLLGGLLLFLTSVYVFFELDKRVELRSFIKDKLANRQK